MKKKMTSEQILMVLGLGTGTGHMPEEELRALWYQHGDAVTHWWQKQFGQPPFVAAEAEQKGWTTCGKKTPHKPRRNRTR
ncbi:MAG: hypothetical protein KF834_04765 [Burkholderiales bacterium]|nr:hypothetical protein [Burkholderiales bacterium]